MAMVSPIYSLRFTLRICVVYLLMDVYSAQLSSKFYKNSCPKALSTIKSTVKSVVANEPRMGASLLRLHFHDCFVDGCEGSLLLDDNSTFLGEKTAFPNVNSVRGYEVIDKIKFKVEKICPGAVSCADIVTLAARDSVVSLGGPSWNVLLGRRDSTTANWAGANSDLPAPFLNLTALISSFSNKGFSVTDMVALSGAHTIGQAQCTTFRDRIYNDTDIDSSFAGSRQSNCPSASGSGDSNLSPLDLQTPNAFDNKYYKNLLHFKGLLHSDQQLYGNKSTDSKVLLYKSHPSAFFADFAAAMVKMSNLSPLTGSAGQIRTNCRVVN